MKLVFDVLPVDREFSKRPPAPPVIYPAPEVSSRDGRWVPPPSAVRALAAGTPVGWTVVTQYSRGCQPHKTTGKPGPVKDWWAVRFTWKDEYGAYAVHDGSGWDTVCVWGKTLPPFLKLGVTDLKQFLADPAACGPAWVDAIRVRVAEQDARAKQREACNRGMHDVVQRNVAGGSCGSCGNTWNVNGDPWRKKRSGSSQGL